jgi:DNA transformation protein
MRRSPRPAKRLNLPNLGPVSERWLLGIGVESLEALRAMGAVEAYHRIRVREGRAATLNLLYSLHAALEGKRWSEVTPAEKARLKRAAGL